MKKILLLAITVATMAVAASKSYSFVLDRTALVGGMTLAPGEYRVEVIDQKAVIRNGKFHGEAPVKVESAETKYNSTAVRFDTADGKMHIQEIHVGGSKTKLVFNE
jgi:hypothetical protein